MRIFLLSVFLAVSISPIGAQTREQALEQLAELQQNIESVKKESQSLEAMILQPDESDIIAAERENLKVFRLLPREKYDKGFFSVRGGGAYFSFTKQSHSYNHTPQIGLEQNYLKVGFAGADYGFITDLGEISLAEINEKTTGASFLMTYEPPTELAKARIEQEKARGFINEDIIYKDRLSAVVGHSFIVRAITYNQADALFAFKIHRKDSDGSLIIFWKPLKEFQVPKLKQTPSVQVDIDAVKMIRQKLSEKGFYNISVDTSTLPMTLRGTVPKGKLAEAIQTVQETNGGKPIKNELTEQ